MSGAPKRTLPGHPLLCEVAVLSLRWLQGGEGVQRLLHRSSIVLMRARRFSFASTVASVDAIAARLLCSPVLPLPSAASWDYVVASLEQHGSATAFVQQLHYLLLHFFRTSPLSFLVPIVPELCESTARSLVDSFGVYQQAAVHALPSVARARSAIQEERWLADEVPAWLCELSQARRLRAAALGCVLDLLDATFPGGNRDTTSARQLVAHALTGPVDKTTPAVHLGLTKLRESAGVSDGRIRALLLRCHGRFATAVPPHDNALHATLEAEARARARRWSPRSGGAAFASPAPAATRRCSGIRPC